MHSQKSVFALLIASTALAASPAGAVDGQVVITHAKIITGDVTPSDDPGYPATLDAPGSYVLGSNLAPGSGLDAIVAAAPDITIDLNGFRISGGPAGGANNARIAINGQSDRLTVKNGTIGAFRLYGIYAQNRSYLSVQSMVIVNGNQGIYNNLGSFARIQNNTVATNTGNGIVCDRSCHVEGNVVSGNGTGVVINSGTVLGNTIINNRSYGIYAPSGTARVGFGNNTLADNNSGAIQTEGTLGKLHPNLCSPVAC